MNNGKIVMQDPQAGQGVEVWDREDKKVVIGDGLKEGAIGGQIIGGQMYSSKISGLDAPIAPPSQFSALEQFFANLITGEVTRQVNEQMTLTKEAMTVFKEEVSDLIGAQLDAIKIEQVAEAVKAAVADARKIANMDSFKEVKRRYNVGLKYEDINNLIEDTRNIREKIFSKRQTLRTVRQSLADADLEVKEAEAGLLADITAEAIPGTDKARFSNDKSRQAELMARKKDDDIYLSAANSYRAVRDQAEAMEDEISSLDGDLKTAEMQFHAECKSLEAMTAEMNIYAAALGAGAYSGAVYGTVELAETVSSLEPIKVCPYQASVGTGEKPEQINAKINSEPKGW